MSVDYESELTASRNEIAAVLGGVIDGLTAGSIRLRTDGDTISIDVPEELALEIECETEDEELSLELELEWPHPETPVEESDGEESVDEEPVGEESVEGRESADEAEPAVPDAPIEAGTASTSLARFEVYQDRRSEWRWRLRHRNGNIIATSGEGYTRKHNARKGLRSVVRNAPDADITDDSET